MTFIKNIYLFIRLFIDSVYNNSQDLLQQYHSQPPPPPMRSTSCYAVLPSTNGHRIDKSYSENNIPTNGKKSTPRVDILQSKNLFVFFNLKIFFGFRCSS